MNMMKKFLLMVIGLAAGAASLGAQSLHRQQVSTNFGLSAPHDPADLPHSRAEIVWPERKPKGQPDPKLLPVRDGSFIIDGGWELAEAGSAEWLDAVVPGTVLTSLVAAGMYPDPYQGLNNLVIPEDLCRKDWWYRTELPLTADLLSKPQLELLFNGINYRAEIWFNGVRLGRIDGAFIRGRFDITALARPSNLLEVHIYPPQNPGIPHEQSAVTGRGPNGGVLCLDGPTFISSEGWDWVPGVRDRNIGLWQDVRLIVSDGLTLGDTQVITDLPLPSTEYADITVRTTVRNVGSVERIVQVSAVTDGLSLRETVRVPAGIAVPVQLTGRLEHPALWMPNGYGDPNLYEMQVSCSADDKVSDGQSFRFGVRELSYELTVDAPDAPGLRIELDPSAGVVFDNRLLRGVGEGVEVPAVKDITGLRMLEPDAMGPYMVVKVNGVRIFCRGGNWGMDDMMKNTSREHLKPYFKLHRAAGFNMVRNWTGESTEETFYELCDEYGLLVWNDFWMSTEGYNLDPHDENLFMANATDVVRRFRNHPSIAVWCPRNEGYATESLERKLSAMIAAEDGTRHYHPNSRYCNLRPSGPWHYFPDAARYYTENAAGFNTELGSPSIPTAASVRRFLPEEDQWPLGDAWHYHDMHPEVKPFVEALDRLYGPAENLDDFCRKAQLMGFDSYRAMFEAWNSRMWDNTSGVLLWMSHPAWPSVEWQTYSWDYETMGSWFGSKKACEPLHVQMNLHDRNIVLINASTTAAEGLSVEVKAFGLDGKVFYSRSAARISAPANVLTEVFRAELPDFDGVALVRAVLRDRKGAVITINDYLLRSGEDFQALNELPAVQLKARRLADGRYEISNPAGTLAVGIKLSLERDGVQVLPAIFSDGYFHLLPGEKRIVSVDFDGGPAVLAAEGYNVSGLR